MYFISAITPITGIVIIAAVITAAVGILNMNNIIKNTITISFII